MKVVLVLLCAVLVHTARIRRETTDVSVVEVDDIIADLGPFKVTDLVLIVDRSTGMGKERFYMQEKKLLQAIVTQYATVHPDYVRVAAITFARHTTVDFDFISNGDGISKCAIFDDPESPWMSLKYFSDPELAHGTNIHDALFQADSILSAGKIHRPNTNPVILLVTDGDYGSMDTDPYATAEQLKNDKGYKIYAVGIGSWLRPGGVRILTTKPEYYAIYDDWEDMVLTNLTSLAAGEPTLWMEEESSTLDPCVDHQRMYCNIHLGYYTCSCDAGYQLDSEECQECPVGAYKESFGNDQCQLCPSDYSTSSTASMSSSACQCQTTCTDLCARDPCRAPKECVLTASNSYECVCPSGYTGASCDIKIDNCDGQTCENNGVCVDLWDGYGCICPYGFTGQKCELDQNECLEDICVNNSTCVDGNNKFTCDCPYGWNGKFCHLVFTTTSSTTTTTTEIPPTTTSNPTTQPTTKLATTAAATKQNDDSQMYIIIGASIGGCFFILLIIVVIVVVCLITRQRSPSSDSEAISATPIERKFEKKSAKKKRASLYNSISHKFSGMWRQNTVRGATPWLDGDSGKRGLPSVPSRRLDVIDSDMDQAEHVVEYTEIRDQEIQVHDGMKGWQKLLNELKTNEVINKGLICKLNSEERASTSTWEFSWDEVSRLEILLDGQETNVPAIVQHGEYVITENDGSLAVGKTIGTRQIPRVVAYGKSKNYLVIGVVENFLDNHVQLKKEIQWLVDHIRSEGY